MEWENSIILEEMISLYTEVRGIYGYRRMTMHINRKLKKQYNHKRIYRLMKSIHMQSVIRNKKRRYIMIPPRITAENLLNRNFEANKPNQKWLTDATEFKLGNGRKAYLSAILDLYDKSIVAYVLGHHNNNEIVRDTFARAISRNSDAHPLFHSDRGYQYTSMQFKVMLDNIGAV